MNYRLIRNIKTKGRFFEYSLPLFFIGIILLFHFFYPSSLGSAIARVASPFWIAERFANDKLHDIFIFFSSKQKLAEDVKRLSVDLDKAYALLLNRDLLIEDNRILREKLGRIPETKSRIIGAILAAPPRSPYDTAIIDVGTINGVAVGDLALSGSVVLGKVSKTYNNTSTVEFFSTAGKKIPLIILHNDEAIPVDGIGEGGGEFRATIPTEISLNIGDMIVMPDFNPLAFAIVNALDKRVTDSFQVVRFRNPLSIQTLRFLEIELGNNKE